MLRTLATLTLAVLAASCASDYTIELRNRTEVELIPYPVVTTPPPPHREADPANALPAGADASIDPTGFNPLYYLPAEKRGFFVQMALDDDPPVLLVRIQQHVVPPGQEGTDPALQPTVLAQHVFEPTRHDLVLILGRSATSFPVTFEQH